MTYLFENNLCKYVRVICKTQSNIWVVHLQSKLKLIDLDFRPHWKKRVGTYNLMGHFNHCDGELILATPTFPILKKYLRLLGRAMNVSAFRLNQGYAYCLEFIQFWSFKLVLNLFFFLFFFIFLFVFFLFFFFFKFSATDFFFNKIFFGNIFSIFFYSALGGERSERRGV